MASTPVSALQPAANAIKMSSTPTAATAVGTATWICAPATGRERNNPATMTTEIPTMNTAVGNSTAGALVANPRRLSAVSTASPPREMGRLSGASPGKADTKAATPAAIDTATVSTSSTTSDAPASRLAR
jgi:hypothetical protein